jgi:preprotein translocase subunit Sec63
MALTSRLLVLCGALLVAAPRLSRAGKDYYKVLEIDKGADDRTLKKAYRAMAM